MSKVSRRKFIQGSLTAAAALPLVSWAKETPGTQTSNLGTNTSAPKEVDVVVVGAGFAGITAMRVLKNAGKRAVLIEARDRLGGRTRTESLPTGQKIDVGGQWVGPGQKRIMNLIHELGIELFPTYNSGKNILMDGEDHRSYEGTIPKINPFALADLGIAMSRLNSLSKTINIEEPWLSAKAEELDSQTLSTWIDAHLWLGPSRKLLWYGLQQLFAADPSRISLLHALYFIRTAGSLEALLDVAGGAQQDRFRMGTESLAKAMVQTFQKDIFLNAPVSAIEQNQSNVKVITKRFAVSAKRVIVAVPPALASRIDYNPSVSSDRDQLTQSMPMGAVLKVMAIYDKPFWRESGYSGQAVSMDGFIFSTFDNSHPDSKSGVLVGFSIGSNAIQLRKKSPSERKEFVIGAFAKFFGNEAKKYTHFIEHDWSEEKWSRGAFLGYFPPGIWTSLGQSLIKPDGRIHWAGTETAREWNGYIEGAIESGDRAAKEVLGLLS